MKKIFFVLITLVLTSQAFAFRIEYGNNIIISKPVYEDLYIAGGTITINAPVYGDLVIAGGTIIINDTITNDIILVGGTVRFNGFVGDDIRCAGGEIRITKNVNGDVVATGGSVTIDKGVTIGGLLASGGDITIDGNVNGAIKGIFGDLVINGYVSKNIDCRGGKITVNGNIAGRSILAARIIVIGAHAAFNNEVRYWNKQGYVDFKLSLQNAKATYDESLRINTGEWYYLGSATLLALCWYLGMALFMILIFQYLFSATVKKAADTCFNRTLRSLATGFLFFITVPVAALIAFISLVAVPVGILLIFFYISIIFLASVITAVVTANWYNNRTNSKWNYWKLSFVAFGIFVLFKLISMVPFAGWIIMTFLVCISFGSILLNVNWKRRRHNATA